MKPAPTQARALKKRQALMDAAFTAFAERGYERTTAKSIAERAGVSVGTFYQYFDNKDDLLLVLTQTRFEFLFERIQSPTLRRSGEPQDIHELFRSVIHFVYEFHAAEPEFHEVLEQRRAVDQALNAVMARGEAVLMERTEQFVRLFDCVDPAAVAYCLFAMAEGLVHRHVFYDQAGLEKDHLIDHGVAMLAAYFEQIA